MLAFTDKAAHGAEGNRTPDLLNAIQALSQLSYGPDPSPMTRFVKKQAAGLTGLEPAASGVTDRHSNQLSYSPCSALFARPSNALTGNRTPTATLKEWCPSR